jgi:non-heme chloroperoxidase
MRLAWLGVVAIWSLVPSIPLRSQQPSGSWQDPSPHTAQFVTVDRDVRLEVLDWGGMGTPLVLLAGGGNTAHVFDEFAPKLTFNHHVYGITRRGFGASGFRGSANLVDRLRDDVIAVLDALKLEKPVLVGHSIAGAEMSAVANSRSGRIAALIYLEAGYPYAFDNGNGPKMAEFQTSGPRAPNPRPVDLASFASLQNWDAEVFGFRMPEAEFRQMWDSDTSGRPRRARDSAGSQALQALMTSTKTYTRIPVPALVVFASPHVPESWIGKVTDSRLVESARTYYAAIDAATARQAAAFEAGVPSARVVRLRGAHYIFLSNERETLNEMRSFLRRLN